MQCLIFYLFTPISNNFNRQNVINTIKIQDFQGISIDPFMWWMPLKFKTQDLKCISLYICLLHTCQHCVQSERDKKVTGGILEGPTQLGELRRLQCNVKACGEDRHSCAEAWWQSESCQSQSPRTLQCSASLPFPVLQADNCNTTTQPI